jgi:hypothetical protein
MVNFLGSGKCKVSLSPWFLVQQQQVIKEAGETLRALLRLQVPQAGPEHRRHAKYCYKAGSNPNFQSRFKGRESLASPAKVGGAWNVLVRNGPCADMEKEQCERELVVE